MMIMKEIICKKKKINQNDIFIRNYGIITLVSK